MADIDSQQQQTVGQDFEDIAKDLPDGLNMDELIQNITKLTMQFVQEQGQKPVQIQLMIFAVFLLVPITLILFCFCKILSSQKKRQGKDKKKQKEQKKETKKETKKESKKKA